MPKLLPKIMKASGRPDLAVSTKLPMSPPKSVNIVKAEDLQPETPPLDLGLPPGIPTPQGPMEAPRIPQLKAGFKPTKLQNQFIKFINQNEGVGIAAHKAGAGKTAASIMAFLDLVKQGKAKKALVVVPAALRANYSKKGVQKFTDASVGVIGSKMEQELHPDMDPTFMGDKDFYVISYAMFKKDPNKYLGMTGADTVIADEMHRMKDPQTQLHKVIKKIRPNVRNFIGLSVSGEESVLIRTRDGMKRTTIGEMAREIDLQQDEIRNGYLGHIPSFVNGSVEWSPIYAIHRYSCDKRCFEVKTELQYPVKITEDHSVFVVENGQVVHKRGDELRVGDYIYSIQELPILDINNIVDIAEECYNERMYIAYPELEEHIEDNCKGYERFNRLHASHGPCWPFDSSDPEIPDDAILYSHRSANKTWFRARVKDVDIAWLLGFFVGDGWMETCAEKKGQRFSFAVEDSLLPEFIDRLNALPGVVNFHLKKLQGCYQVRCNCRPLALWLKQYFYGKKCYSKRIPSCVYEWSEAARRLFIEGLVASDGHIDKKNRVSYTTTSKELTWDIVWLLRTIGLSAAIYNRGRSTSPRDRSRLGRESYSVQWSHDLFLGKVRGNYSTDKRNAKALGLSEETAYKVLSIQETKMDDVYDLSVAGAENFFANTLLCHNTASPAMNNPFEAVSLINAISKKKMTPAEFQKRFYERSASGIKDWFFGLMGHEKHGPIKGWKQQKELGKLVGSVHHFADPKIEGMPDKDLDVVRVPMSPKQTKDYQDILNKKLTKVERRVLEEGQLLPEVEIKKIVNKVMAARQISNNAGYVKGLRSVKDNPKALSMIIDTIKELKENKRGQVVMFSNFIDHGTKVLEHALKEAKIPYGTFTGRDSKVKRQQMVQDYNMGKLKVLIASGAGGEGLDLPNTTLVQMMDGHYNPEKIIQAEARGIRKGGLAYLPKGKRKVRVRRYVSVPSDDSMSIDESIYSIAAKKHKLVQQFKDIVRNWQKAKIDES